MTNLQKIRNGIAALATTALYGASVVMAQGTGFLNTTDNPGKVSAATGGQTSFRALLLVIVDYFLGFLGLIAVLMIIYGGVQMVTSQGNPEAVNKGKKIITYAGIGIVIILLSFAIVSTILGAGAGTQQ